MEPQDEIQKIIAIEADRRIPIRARQLNGAHAILKRLDSIREVPLRVDIATEADVRISHGNRPQCARS